jgi:GT2 family glycosyltransferase
MNPSNKSPFRGTDPDHHHHLPISSALSAEALAQRALSAMRSGRLDDAIGISETMRQKYPSLPESHVLYARALAAAKRFSAAFDVWDDIIERTPLQMIWLEQAIRLALSHGNVEALKRWTGLMENIFIHPPSAALLSKLDQQGWPIRGSVGIHCNQVLAWTWLPAGTPPRIEPYGGPAPTLIDSSRKVHGDHVLSRFSLALPNVEGSYFLRLSNAQKQDIQGSPLTCESALSIISKQEVDAPSRPAVLVPVYDDKKATKICLASLLASRRACTTPFEIVVVWDHGPDKDLFSYLHKLARNRKIQLITTPRNLGFLGAINHALRQYGNRDIVLLNADTIVHGDWFDRLHQISRSRRNIGTITPMGSFAELVSYPSIQKPANVTTRRTTAVLDQACREVAGKHPWRDIPVGVGFCMYVTRTLLQKIGGFDGRWLFSGYGEEVDLCLRARKAGFRNLAALNVFVAHFGGRSFGLRKKALVAQNNKALFTRYPDYVREYHAFLRDDPLCYHREAISRKLYTPLNGPLHIFTPLDIDSPTVAAIREESEQQDKSWAAMLVQNQGGTTAVTLRVRQNIDLADVHFSLPRHGRKLQSALAKLAPEKLLLHGFTEPVRQLAQRFKYPMELYLGQLPAELLRLWQEKKPCPTDSFTAMQRIHCHNTWLARWLAEAGLPVAAIVPQQCSPPLRNCSLEESLPSAWLTPPPRNLTDWQRLCSEARRQGRHGTLFYVPELEAAWGHAPRPANVRPCPPLDQIETAPAQAMLLTGTDPEHLSAWSSWAASRNIPCYLPANPSNLPGNFA